MEKELNSLQPEDLLKIIQEILKRLEYLEAELLRLRKEISGL